MSKIKDVVYEIKEEAGDIELKAKRLNAQLDSKADSMLQKGERSQFTGLAMLVAILVVLFVVAWLFVRH